MGRLRGNNSSRLRGPECFDPVLWKDIVKTFQEHPHCFVRGCGQETLVYWIRDSTKRFYDCKVVRRCLLAAVAMGKASVHFPSYGCTRFSNIKL